MTRFARSFAHALRGIRYALSGRNFRVQAIIALAVLGLSCYLRISPDEWLAVIFAIGLVLSMEATNTAVEEICNKFHPETHPHIALIKDLAAGAVLIASLAALAIGLVVFLPYIS
ncbi:MAG: diacylglycerol kinase family protein [Candidatus Paceibacterota bacterium]|jgi:diacylglycerol kinase (ATP)